MFWMHVGTFGLVFRKQIGCLSNSNGIPCAWHTPCIGRRKDFDILWESAASEHVVRIVYEHRWQVRTSSMCVQEGLLEDAHPRGILCNIPVAMIQIMNQHISLIPRSRIRETIHSGLILRTTYHRCHSISHFPDKPNTQMSNIILNNIYCDLNFNFEQCFSLWSNSALANRCLNYPVNC